MRKEHVDLLNKLVFIADSKTPTGVAEVPLTDMAVEAFQKQMELAGPGPWLFPSSKSPTGYQGNFHHTWERTLRRAGIPYFRLYDLRSTYATRLSAGGVADEWVTQLLRQTDAKVFKKYSQMKLQMKREALAKLNRQANENECASSFDTVLPDRPGFDTVLRRVLAEDICAMLASPCPNAILKPLWNPGVDMRAGLRCSKKPV